MSENEKLDLKRILILILQGAIVGAGGILPGVSGGILCVAFGLYMPLMQFLANPLKEFPKSWKKWMFVGIGGCIGLVFFAVVVPICNEEKYIRACIESIIKQDFPKDDLEVIFVDGMSSDKTRLIISDYIEQYPFICIVDNPQKIVPVAMNIGIRASKGEVIIRLDAHACYTENYFSVLCDYLNILDAENVGAACVTDVLNRTPKSLAIKEVLSNKFGVGNSVFRTGVVKSEC